MSPDQFFLLFWAVIIIVFAGVKAKMMYNRCKDVPVDDDPLTIQPVTPMHVLEALDMLNDTHGCPWTEGQQLRMKALLKFDREYCLSMQRKL